MPCSQPEPYLPLPLRRIFMPGVYLSLCSTIPTQGFHFFFRCSIPNLQLFPFYNPIYGRWISTLAETKDGTESEDHSEPESFPPFGYPLDEYRPIQVKKLLNERNQNYRRKDRKLRRCLLSSLLALIYFSARTD